MNHGRAQNRAVTGRWPGVVEGLIGAVVGGAR